jgi:hypothetical protein
MSQTYNYIGFIGNDDLEIMLLEIERRFNEFKVNNPSGFSESAICRIFYGLEPIEFQKSKDISDVTKGMLISYFSANESELISGYQVPTDFQNYLTVALAKIDPYVIGINDFNTTNDDEGYYITLCKDAVNGDFQVVYEYESTEGDEGMNLSLIRKKSIKNLHAKVPWSKKVLKA